VHLAGRGVGVLATDASAEMLGQARAKIARSGLAARVGLRQLAIEQLHDLVPQARGTLDGAFSSFGGVNCVVDLGALAGALGELLRPGARVVLCVMGPLVPWEWAWFLARGDLRRAFRRLAPGGVPWRGMTVRYPSIRVTRRAFTGAFRLLRVGGLGTLVPPTYGEPWARRHPRVVERLDRWERRIETWPLVAWLGDHYLMELERR
jgi:SAM-dependent methyltransferase